MKRTRILGCHRLYFTIFDAHLVTKQPNHKINHRSVQSGYGEFYDPLSENERPDGHDPIKGYGDKNKRIDELGNGGGCIVSQPEMITIGFGFQEMKGPNVVILTDQVGNK